MSIADGTWLLTLQFVSVLGLNVLIELVFAGLAITVIRARRPRGGLLLFGAVLVGLVLTSATSVAYPVLFGRLVELVDTESFVGVQVGLNLVSSFIHAVVRIVEIAAIVAVALDPGPGGDVDEPRPL